jgi:hypothetical protein
MAKKSVYDLGKGEYGLACGDQLEEKLHVDMHE